MNRKYVTQVSLAGRLSALVLVAVGLTACGGGSEVTNSAVQVPVQAVNINVQSAEVTPSYTLDGGAFPVSEYNDGNLVLRSITETDDIAMLGSSHDVSADPFNLPDAAPVRVVQDSYDVLFQHETGDSVPQNVDTPVQAAGLINKDVPLAIAVGSWSVTPTFQHNDAAFPSSEYDDGVFYLQPVDGGDRIFLGNSHTASPDVVRVMAGRYDVVYALETGGNQVPGNQNVVVDKLNINADVSPAINVTSGRITVDAKLDTADFQVSQYQQAEFFLRNSATGDIVTLGTSTELPISRVVVAGTYDIVYRHLQGDTLPVNTDAVIAAGVVVDGAGKSVSVDISSVAITPSFTLDNGSGPTAFPQSEYNDANFYLRSVGNPNDVMFIGASEVAPAAVRVISSAMDTDIAGGGVLFGAYDVLYRHESGELVPQNSNALVRSNVTIDSDTSPFAVAVTSINVSGKFTLNGSGFPSDAGNSVQFFLRGDDLNDRFPFGFSDISNEPVRVVSIPGSYETYDVFMDHLAGDGVPQNAMHEMAFNKVLDTDGMTLNVNIPAVRVDPHFTLDGVAFPASIYQSARFYLRDIHGGGLIFLGRSYADNDPVMVIKEDHDIIYQHFSGEQVPQNTNSKILRVDL